MIGGISFSATSITSGLDADKPVNPKAGNQYLATDTKIVYVCYVAGVWVNAAPVIKLTDLEHLVATQGSAFSVKSFLGEFTENVSGQVWTTMAEFTVTEFINISTVSGLTIIFATRGGNTYYDHHYRVLINDVSVGSGDGNTSAWVGKTVQVSTPLKIGDNVKVQLYLDLPGVTDVVGIRNINFMCNISRVLKTPEIVTET